MTKYCILLFIVTVFTSVARDLHTPAEIFKVMEDSKLMYYLQITDTTWESPDYSDRLNDNRLFRELEQDSHLVLKKYDFDKKIEKLSDTAYKYMLVQNFDSTMIYYKKIIELDTTLAFIYTSIGNIFYINKEMDSAEVYLKKAIQKNYIDYMAHWFLADVYLTKDKMDEAVDEITIAKILNRNNPRLDVSFKNIFRETHRITEDWSFNPQYKISKSDSGINVAFNPKWMGYAIAKAVWKYEPGYRESMGVEEGQYTTDEELECVIALIPIIEDKKDQYIKNDTQLEVLMEAIENKLIYEYIYFEIFLPLNPKAANLFPETVINNIKKYILEVRHPKE